MLISLEIMAACLLASLEDAVYTCCEHVFLSIFCKWPNYYGCSIITCGYYQPTNVYQ